ncbi:MAG: non-ribosomal peptide synthetase, partial [Lysobacter sp.]|nr:non-ribosomal peptide synthetase [Lysobacter sp.]
MTQERDDTAAAQARLEALRRAVALKRLRAAGGTATDTMDMAADKVAIPRIDRAAALPLSWAQRRLWFLDRLDSAAGAAYRIGTALRLRGGLRPEALIQALSNVVMRHEVLRTRFVERAGEPELRIDPTADGFAVSRTDLSALAPDRREQRLHRLCEEEARLPFDLTVDLPMRARLIRLAEDDHVLVLVQHHIVSDGWSIGVLVREVAMEYAAAAAASGSVSVQPPMPVQYVDYAAWQRQRLSSSEFETRLAAWREELTDAPVLSTLPADRPRPARPRYRGARVRIAWSPQEVAALRRLATEVGATPFAVLFSAWSVLLARLTGQRDVIVGTPVANRPRSELEGLIGLFVDTLPVRIRLPDAANVSTFVRTVHDRLLACLERQDVPFDRIVDAVRPERALNHSPLFQTMVAFDNTPSAMAIDSDLRIEAFPFEQDTSSHDLVLHLGETAEGMAGALTYDIDLFEQRTVERWAACFQRLVVAMTHDPRCPIDALPLLSDAERHRLLATFNATQTEYAGAETVHALFEAQAARCPDAVAVESEDGTLS